MACSDGISKKITSDCTTSRAGGLEVEGYIINRGDVDITYEGNKITDISKPSEVATIVAYKVKGTRKMLNCGSSLVQADDMPNMYAHKFSFKQFEVLAANRANVDNMNDVIVVVERKHKTSTGEGVFVVLGPKKGLFKTGDSLRENDNNGSRSLELSSMPGQEEEFSQYTYIDTNYATTKAHLETLIIDES
jgi:hypothetical protein